MDEKAHLIIEEVSRTGQPLRPIENANAFVSQCGVLVRDNIPITCREWHKPKKVEGVSFVDDRVKDSLWDSLMSHFTLPALETDELTEAAPEFTGPLEKQRDH